MKPRISRHGVGALDGDILPAASAASQPRSHIGDGDVIAVQGHQRQRVQVGPVAAPGRLAERPHAVPGFDYVADQDHTETLNPPARRAN